MRERERMFGTRENERNARERERIFGTRENGTERERTERNSREYSERERMNGIFGTRENKK